jgi:SAM-dependent methyltransferase
LAALHWPALPLPAMNPFYKLAHPICRHFRAKRIQRFLDLFRPDSTTRILDVGGLPRFWSIPVEAQITIVNLTRLDENELSFARPGMSCIVGDGTRLPYADGEFDIVFSNSVIEHVGTFENQVAFAREARRVGRGYWIQTPAYEFPVEPHYWAPGVHWCSKPVQRRLLRNFTLWGLMGRPSPTLVDLAIAEVRLMRRREFVSLFPDGQIWTERLLGVAKSYTAYKLPAAVAHGTAAHLTTAA